MNKLVLDYLFCILETSILLMVCGMFLHQKGKYGMRFVPGILAIAMALHLMQWLGIHLSLAKLLVGITVDLIFIHWHFHGELLKKLFILTGFLLSSAAAQGLAAAYTKKICMTELVDITNTSDPNATIVAALYLIILILLLFIFERFRTVKAVPLSNRTWLCLITIPLASLFIVWYLFPFGKGSVGDAEMRLVEGMSFFLIFINYISFALYRTTAVNVTLKQQCSDTQAALVRERTHYTNLLSAQEQIRDHLHDYQHVLGFLSTLLAAGQTREAAFYLQKLLGNIRSARSNIHTGNPQIDALLSQKISECIEMEIKISVSGRLPSELNFDALDICILIGNALDNAIEACVRQRITGKCVSAQFLLDHGSLLIEISNKSMKPTSQKTTKFDSKNHGRGLLIMQRIAEKYGGNFIYEHKNGRFIVSILLQNPPK